MTRRSGRPFDRHNRSHRAADLAAKGRDTPATLGETQRAAGRGGVALLVDQSPWWSIGLAVAALAYAGLFFSTPHHRAWLFLPLVPEMVVGNWFGGAGWSGVGGWDRVGLAVALVAMTGLACGWGECLRRIFRIDRSFARHQDESDDPWRRWALRAALGWPCVSTTTLLVGLAGCLRNPGLVLGVLGVASAALAGLALLRRHLDALRAESAAGNDLFHPSTRGSSWTSLDWGLAVVVVVASALIVCGGMLPAWEFDVREYHLQAPKEWWQRGRIEFLPHNIYANMPLGAEMFSLLAMTLWPGDEAWWWGGLVGKAAVATFAPWTAALLIAIGRWWNAPRAGWIAAALYLTTPWTAHVAMSGLIDGVLAFFVLATAWFGMALTSRDRRLAGAVASGGGLRGESSSDDSNGERRAVLWGETREFASGWGCGWMAGAAAACKYPGVAFALTPVVAGIGGAWLLRRVGWKCVAGMGLAAFLVAGPWYAKNLIFVGNPTYPLFAQVWGDETRSPERDSQWRRAHREVDRAGSSYSWELFSRAVARVGWRSDWLHPTLWPLAIVGLLSLRSVRGGWTLAVAIGWIFVVWWGAAHRIDRFWLPALPGLALCAGWGAVARSDRAWRGVVVTVAGAGIGLGWLASVATGPLDNPLGDVRFFASLARLRELNQHPLQIDLERRVPSGFALLMVGGAQPYDWRCEVRYSTCFDESPLERIVASTLARERRQAFWDARISHVWVDWGEIARYRQPGNYGFAEFATPELFDELQRQGVLRRLPADPKWGALYEVASQGEGRDADRADDGSGAD